MILNSTMCATVQTCLPADTRASLQMCLVCHPKKRQSGQIVSTWAHACIHARERAIERERARERVRESERARARERET